VRADGGRWTVDGVAWGRLPSNSCCAAHHGRSMELPEPDRRSDLRVDPVIYWSIRLSAYFLVSRRIKALALQT